MRDQAAALLGARLPRRARQGRPRHRREGAWTCWPTPPASSACQPAPRHPAHPRHRLHAVRRHRRAAGPGRRARARPSAAPRPLSGTGCRQAARWASASGRGPVDHLFAIRRGPPRPERSAHPHGAPGIVARPAVLKSAPELRPFRISASVDARLPRREGSRAGAPDASAMSRQLGSPEWRPCDAAMCKNEPERNCNDDTCAADRSVPSRDAVLLRGPPWRTRSPDLTGYWSGNGSIALANGKTERVKCQVIYKADGGDQIRQTMRCASADYTINALAELRLKGGQVSGHLGGEDLLRQGRCHGALRRRQLRPVDPGRQLQRGDERHPVQLQAVAQHHPAGTGRHPRVDHPRQGALWRAETRRRGDSRSQCCPPQEVWEKCPGRVLARRRIRLGEVPTVNSRGYGGESGA